jgi:DNA-binding MarR family transcriptional regulator
MSPSPGGQTSIGSAEYQAVAQLRTALGRFNHVTAEIARRNGLTTRRYELLVMIAGADDPAGVTASELARRLYLALHTVTELVARAEEAGLVRRAVDRRDRRISRITLTAEGAARLAAAAVELRPERRRLSTMLADISAQARALARG